MKDLASIVDGQPMADSRDLVDVFGIQHRSIYRLIKIHEVKLKRFGKVRFEITKPAVRIPHTREELATLVF